MVRRESIHVYNTCTIGLNGKFAETRISIRTLLLRCIILYHGFCVFKILFRQIKNSYLSHLHVFTHICTYTYKENDKCPEWAFLNRIIVTLMT